MSEDTPVQFTFRPWRSDHESWEVYLAALETAYARYLERYRRERGTDPPASEPEAASECKPELTPPPP
jgi:hypothetical protein